MPGCLTNNHSRVRYKHNLKHNDNFCSKLRYLGNVGIVFEVQKGSEDSEKRDKKRVEEILCETVRFDNLKGENQDKE